MGKSNEFKLIGRVGKLDMAYKETGTVLTKISLGVKKSKDTWENFWITFFNKKNHPTAEILAEEVKEGDYIRVEGVLGINSYTPTGQEKPTKTIQLIGWGFKKVKWDTESKKFIDVEKPQEEESEYYDDLIGDDEIPF